MVEKKNAEEKKNHQEKDYVRSNKKINAGILRLLETLTLVSSQQNKQMEKIKASIREKPQNIHHFWNQIEQKTNETKNQMKALSIKVDNFIGVSDGKKELAEESITQQKSYLLQNVASILSNMSHKVPSTYLFIVKYCLFVTGVLSAAP